MAKKNKKSPVRWFALIIGLVLILVFGGFFVYSQALKPVNQDVHTEFEVVSGESIHHVLTRLEEEGLISNQLFAQLYVRLNGNVSLKVGVYDLDGYMDVKTILETLSNASLAHRNDIKVTIIEGEWCKHIASKLAEALSIQSEDLLALWNDEDYIRSLMSDYPFLTDEIFNEDSRYYLEGYLMPNTYYFAPNSTLDEITRRFLDQSLVVFNKYQDEMKSSNFSIHELYTLASIVQYEASKKEDMELIAGVFYNRLNISMALQSSVTVCYAIDMEKDDDWKDCETNPNFDSPYNTYLVQGLPPGPILNPGEDAIQAVLNPKPSDYLYFLADVYGDGTVYYSKTYAEHLAYKAKYLD